MGPRKNKKHDRIKRMAEYDLKRRAQARNQLEQRDNAEEVNSENRASLMSKRSNVQPLSGGIMPEKRQKNGREASKGFRNGPRKRAMSRRGTNEVRTGKVTKKIKNVPQEPSSGGKYPPNNVRTAKKQNLNAPARSKQSRTIPNSNMDLKSELSKIVGKFTKLSDKYKALLAKNKLAQKELEFYRSVYGEIKVDKSKKGNTQGFDFSIDNDEESESYSRTGRMEEEPSRNSGKQEADLLNPFAAKPKNLPQLWHKIDKMQKTQILRLKKENYRLRSMIETNGQTENVLHSFSYDLKNFIDNFEATFDPYNGHGEDLDDSLERKQVKSLQQREKEACIITGKTLDCLNRLNIQVDSTVEELKIIEGQNRSKNLSQWSYDQQNFRNTSFQADMDQLIAYLFDYSGRLMQKIGQLDQLLNSKDHHNAASHQNTQSGHNVEDYTLGHLQAIKVLRDNLIDEVVLIEKKTDLFSNYKQVNKKFMNRFRKKAKEQKQLFSAQLRSYLDNLGQTLDQNLKELVHSNSEIDHVFLYKFFENTLKEDNIDIEKELGYILIKLSYFDYMNLSKKYRSKFSTINKVLGDFTKEFTHKISDPIYEMLNLLDQSMMSEGQSHVYLKLKKEVVDNLESFLRQDYKASGYSTIVTLKALKALSILAKKYYTTMETLGEEENQFQQ